MAKDKSKIVGAGGKGPAKGAGKKAGGRAKPVRSTRAAPSAQAPVVARSKTDAPLAIASAKDNAKAAGSPRAGSKLAIVLGMLRQEGGASIDAIMQATGWLSHTTRAVLTGLKKRGFVIERQAGDKDSPSVYRIIADAAAGQTTSSAGSPSGAPSSPPLTKHRSGESGASRASRAAKRAA